jgi:hypothetical protein
VRRCGPHERKRDDEKIATVATYVRNIFGNKSGSVTADQVAKARATFEGESRQIRRSATSARIP